jgi:hypothetical protein
MPIELEQLRDGRMGGFDTPEADRFAADADATLGQELFDEWSGTPAVAQTEAIVEPVGITDDISGARSRGNR